MGKIVMRKFIVLLAATCLLGMTGSSFAGAPIKGTTVKGGRNCPPFCKTGQAATTPGDPATHLSAKRRLPSGLHAGTRVHRRRPSKNAATHPTVLKSW